MNEKIRGITAGSGDMEELSALCEAAGIEVICEILQPAERMNRATYLGKGKVEELIRLVKDMEADILVTDDELSGAQLRNLEDAAGIRVIDRTMLILDIFAARARSREGSLQVELAQLRYRLPRLTGFGGQLSRQGAGIGTRGPGEKKLESDRRHIHSRIDSIKRELEKAGRVRQTTAKRRKVSGIPVIALAGYTNAGKSSIMNRLLELQGADDRKVYEEDMPFASLDTAHRRVSIPGRHEFLLTDTVGFVSRMPRTLEDAFRSTLEEVRDGDILLHVVDCSAPDPEFNMAVTERMLKELGAGDSRIITVFNKTDKAAALPQNTSGRRAVYMSAATGEGLDDLLDAIDETIAEERVRVRLKIPYSEGRLLSFIMDRGRVIAADHDGEGHIIDCELAREDCMKVKAYGTVQTGI